MLFGVAHGANIPSIQTAVAGLAPLESRAAFMSINSTMLRLGQTVGPPLMGIIYLHGQAETTFLVASGLAVLVPVVAIIFGQIKTEKA
jgi:MFS family permease